MLQLHSGAAFTVLCLNPLSCTLTLGEQQYNSVFLPAFDKMLMLYALCSINWTMNVENSSTLGFFFFQFK